MASSIKVNGVWKNTPAYNVKINGVWKPATNAYVKVNGVWKTYFTAGGGSTGPGPVIGIPVINASPSLSLGYDGVTMQVAAGSWLGGVDSYSYEWFINGSSTSAYGPTQNAIAGLIGSPGAQYYVKVTATNVSGSTVAVSNTIGLPAKASAAAPAQVVVSAPATPSVSLGYTDVASVWSSSGSNWTTEGYITLQWNYSNVNTSGIIVSFSGQGDIAPHAAITSPNTADVHSPYNVTGTIFVIVTFPDGTAIRSNEVAYTNLHQQVTSPTVPTYTTVTPPAPAPNQPAPAAVTYVTLYPYTTNVQGTSGNISNISVGSSVQVPADVAAGGNAAINSYLATNYPSAPQIVTGTAPNGAGVTQTVGYSTNGQLISNSPSATTTNAQAAVLAVTTAPGAYVAPTTTTVSQTTSSTVNGGTSGGSSSGSTTVTPASSGNVGQGNYGGLAGTTSVPTTTTTTSTSTAISAATGTVAKPTTTTVTIAPGITVTTSTTATQAYIGSTLQTVTKTTTTTTAATTSAAPAKTGGGGCFLFGTSVLKADGSWINIEQLKPGDALTTVSLPGLNDNELAEDWFHTWSIKDLNNIEKTTTVVTHVNRSSYWRYYTLNGTIKVTYEHKVLVRQGGVWRFNQVEDISIGDMILDENLNEVVIKSKKETQEDVAVVGIDTEVKDTYFVKGMLAHNFYGPAKS
jgi:hypothetical protein